jgi:serine/threonine protein kinase
MVYAGGDEIPGTRFRVVRPLGSTRAGMEYEVEAGPHRYVLLALDARGEKLNARVTREVMMARKLHHVGIATPKEGGLTADGCAYIVREHLSGRTVRSILDTKGPIAHETAYAIAIDVLDALEHAHAMGVLHRALAPERIFLQRMPDKKVRTLVLDFGVGGLVHLGPRYSSPEQVRGEQPTPQSDLYAVALVLYEMIAGRGPFDEAPDERAMAQLQLVRRAPAISKHAAGIPVALEELLLSALVKRAIGRPKDAATFAAKLRALVPHRAA